MLAVLLLLALTASVGTFAAQRPLAYQVVIGREEGWHSDLPLIQDWNTAEVTDAGLAYRWSGRDSSIQLPGAGSRPVVMTIGVLPASINPQRANGHLALEMAGGVATLPIPTARRMVIMLLPHVPDGNVRVGIDAPLFTPPNDPRVLGVPFTSLHLASIGQGYTRLPSALWWPLLFVPLVWLLLRGMLIRSRPALAACVALMLVCGALQADDPPRFALLGGPLISSLVWGLVLGAVLDVLLRRFLPRLGVHVSAQTRRGVILIFVALWSLRYAARLYPEAMVGDLGFHANRTTEVSHGLLFIVSRHRGIDFPYPSGLYAMMLPVTLVMGSITGLIEWMDAWWGALGVLPLAYLGYYVGRHLAAGDQQRAERMALLCAGAYAALAPAMMALFWSFLPHIFAQEMASLLIAGLVGAWYWLERGRVLVLMFTGLALIFFGHIGLYINISLLVGLVVVWRWFLCREATERRNLRALVIAFVLAQVLVLTLFYSSYWALVSDKLQAFAAGGMSAVQENRVPTRRIDLLRTLWSAGVGAHYAWIGLPLGLLGGVLLWRRLPRNVVTTLWWSTLLVAIVQALIPFLTRSTISTRWLSFSAWIVAVGLAVVADWLWRRGRLGSLTALLIYGWIAGSTLWMWVEAGGFRIRPPEPF